MASNAENVSIWWRHHEDVMFLDTVVQTVCFVSLIVLPHSKKNLHNRLRKQATDTPCPWVKRSIYLTVQSDTGASRFSMYNAGCATKEPTDSSDINWNGQQTIRVYYSRSLQWNIQIFTCDDQRPRDNKISKLIAEYPYTAWLCYTKKLKSKSMMVQKNF